ncbi:SgcJ/EcaC family oxidoreductase [Micromonospora sp. NPDC000207]|uniref:SgcJ/EcaC family oxidoreductase n=1 Tax=Micromonospora sp. NPDC000207 TaxID=3154246 RepID=UPI00332A09CF
MSITEQTSPAATGTDPKAEVAALPQRLVAAWAEHDSAVFAQLFTPDGTMILPGVFCQGHEQIQQFMTNAFAGPYRGTRVTGQPFNIRFLGPDTVVMLTQGGVLAPGEEEVSAERAVRACWLAVRTDGQWRLAAYQNSPKN